MEAVATQVGRRARALSVSLEGDALLDEAVAAISTMQRLVERSGDVLASVRAALEHVERRATRREVYVALAGVRGSGRRTFLDALTGEPRLGQACESAPMPTFLRNGATPQFQARLADGSVADFAELVPDRSREHDQRLREAEAAFAEAQRTHAELDASAKTAADAHARAKDELQRCARTAESASQAEQSTLALLASAQQAEEEARRMLERAESAVPRRLRAPASEMGFSTRLWRRSFTLFSPDTWRNLELARMARMAARERCEAMRERAAELAEERQHTWEAMREPQAVADARLEDSDNARRAADRAKVDLERARSTMQGRREELARYVEDRLTRFFEGIRELSDGRGRGSQVLELRIEYPSERIPEDVVLIGVPEVGSDADRSRRVAARALIEEVADGIVVIWDAESEVDAACIELLRGMSRALPRMVLVVNKADRIFLDAVREGHAEPWDRVDETRREAALDFARIVGRDPACVVSVAFAAKAALEDPGSGLESRFWLEAAKLFELLRQERAILVGAQAERLLAPCIKEAEAATERANVAYKSHVAELEAQRMPAPEAFHQSALRDAEPIFGKASAAATVDVAARLREAYGAMKASLGELALTDGATAAVLIEKERALSARADKVDAKAQRALERALSTTLEALESRLFAELGKRYGLNDVAPLRTDAPTLPALDEQPRPLAAPRVPGLVASLRRARLRLGVLGAALGTAAGWLAAPPLLAATHLAVPRLGLAALVGVLGALLAFTKTWSRTRAAALSALDSALTKQESAAIARVEAQESALCATLHQALDSSVELVIIRHGRRMLEPTETRERALDAERADLGELGEIAETLNEHAANLRLFSESSTELSMLMCR